ncbi:hypothetical protein SO802_002656 [Lithocarpus litseifolius]|uniref:Uncharacterized protein n=1 Tax=Lithocarpus litseifolius TaxID=425828 RepID=A0AAW2E0G5_9ROSI
MPNLFRVLGSIDTFNKMMGLRLTWHDVVHMYDCHSLADAGYYFKSRSNVVRLVSCLPKSDKGMKDDYLIVSGEWHNGHHCPTREEELDFVPLSKNFQDVVELPLYRSPREEATPKEETNSSRLSPEMTAKKVGRNGPELEERFPPPPTTTLDLLPNPNLKKKRKVLEVEVVPQKGPKQQKNVRDKWASSMDSREDLSVAEICQQQRTKASRMELDGVAIPWNSTIREF